MAREERVEKVGNKYRRQIIDTDDDFDLEQEIRNIDETIAGLDATKAEYQVRRNSLVAARSIKP